MVHEAMTKFYDKDVAERSSVNSKNNYTYVAQAICKAFGHDTPLDEMTTPLIAAWQEKMIKSGLAASTANQSTKVLATVLRVAHRKWETLTKLPVFEPVKGEEGDEGKDDKKHRWITVAEEARCCSRASGTCGSSSCSCSARARAGQNLHPKLGQRAEPPKQRTSPRCRSSISRRWAAARRARRAAR